MGVYHDGRGLGGGTLSDDEEWRLLGCYTVWLL
jgi:hypothetical protein